VPKFGRKVPHLICDSHNSFKIKRSEVRVTRPINADTHRAPYLPNGKAYELQTWYTDGGRRPTSATGAMTSKVKVTRSHDQFEPCWPNVVSVSLEAGGGIPCRPNLAATLLVLLISDCDVFSLAGKGDIFGDSVQDVYLSDSLTSVTGQHAARPVISVTDSHGTAVGKSCYAVTAISYCDLHKISLSDLAAILDVYPEFANQFLHNFYITFNLRQVRS